MPCWHQYGGSPVARGPLNIAANEINAGFGCLIVPWVCTARATLAGADPESTRETPTVYWRGVKESIRVTTSSSLPWEWRRIKFTFKGNGIMSPSANSASAESFIPLFNHQPGVGYTRFARPLTHAVSTAAQLQVATTLMAFMFRGTYGLDFGDPMTAPTQTEFLKIISDKRRTIASGNDTGIFRNYSEWTGINKNILYQDRERGEEEVTNALSVQGRPGYGDVYIVDFFRPHPGATTDDFMQFEPQATAYWHER